MSRFIDEQQSSKGLALTGLLVGLLTGAAIYGVIEYWTDDADENPIAVVTLLFLATASAAFLLLAETGGQAKAAILAAAMAAILAAPDYFMFSSLMSENENLTEFPGIFWVLVGRTLAAYLMVTLIKAAQESGAPPPYERVFLHGLTLPFIGGGAALFAGLALVLLFAWARLLKEMDVYFFNKLFQEAWFILPFLGAIGGLSIAMMRSQRAVLSALRYILLLFCRIVAPITAAFTVTFLIVLVVKGADPIFDKPYPAAIMIGLALIGMLIFNGVYQNGEAHAPTPWLRLATLTTLFGFPVYTGLALYALTLRIGDYGLTPPRIAGLAITGLVAAYSIVCLAGLLSEIRWRAKKWMAPVAPLNTGMAVLWVVVLTAMATPLCNPWAISAKSQYRLLADQRIAAADFDFGYLRFELGRHGDKALEKLVALDEHPEAGAIREAVDRARDAETRWEYDHPELVERFETDGPVTVVPDGPMGLELNPKTDDIDADAPIAPEETDE